MGSNSVTRIAPFFIVKDVPASLKFYKEMLGFDITFQGPEPSDIFFGIVERDAAMFILKSVGVEPMPNYTCDIKQVLHDGMLICTFPTLKHWLQNLVPVILISLHH